MTDLPKGPRYYERTWLEGLAAQHRAGTLALTRNDRKRLERIIRRGRQAVECLAEQYNAHVAEGDLLPMELLRPASQMRRGCHKQYQRSWLREDER